MLVWCRGVSDESASGYRSLQRFVATNQRGEGVFRLALSTQNEDIIAKTADVTRDICHSRDVAIVIKDHFLFVEKHGLDGVHLSDGSRNVRKARKNLAKDSIVGAFCGKLPCLLLVTRVNG